MALPDDELTRFEEVVPTPSLDRAPFALEPAMTVVTEEGGTTPRPGLVTAPPLVSERYEDCGQLGRGGMAEVRRVYDRLLGRTVALKVLRPELADDEHMRNRFLREARITAQLQHPCIPPVHDIGLLPDGRPWFTLKEIRGQTLMQALQDFHASGGEQGPDGPATLRRLVEAIRAAASALAHAHDRGVVHRDFKPSNLMIGQHGEVLVLDWGIARLGDETDIAMEGPAAVGDETGVGVVLGTRGFIAPEQETGEATPASDVYALGHVLARLVRAAEGKPPSRGIEALRRLAGVATAPDPRHRPASADEVVRKLVHWLDGTDRRAEAMASVREAQAMEPMIREREAEAARLRGEAAARLAVAANDVAAKAEAWTLEDRADAARREASLLSIRREQLLHGALVRAEDLDEAHLAWVDLLRRQQAEAEAARDEDRATEAEIRLRAHLDALPHAAREPHLEWLQGDGSVRLQTSPPGAWVEIRRVETRGRRRVEVPHGRAGPTPVDLPLPHGSYVFVLRAPGREEVRLPVFVGRAEKVRFIPPGERTSEPVLLPPEGSVGREERYVPAGWYASGGDPVALNGQPARRVWVDGFVIQRFPITNAEYIAFLDALVADGREAEALERAPRTRPGRHGEAWPLVYGRRADGTFTLVPDADGDLWQPDWPVLLLCQADAWAYARWRAERDGLPWRLPGEHEWEKAARGVDGRLWPFGDHFEPAWACMRDSHAGVGQPVSVFSFPDDESPYGVRGLAGGVRDWCADPHYATDLVDREGRARPAPREPLPPGTWVSARGGYWMAPDRGTRCAARYQQLVELRNESIGIRLVRSV